MRSNIYDEFKEDKDLQRVSSSVKDDKSAKLSVKSGRSKKSGSK